MTGVQTCALPISFQLYFDFSGYTDMALAVALLFNIKLPINFNSPYKALNIQDFWRRWHITLSRFLRDYIYIPLGGNRGGEIRTYANLFSVFLIGGLWHGASWMFVIWGALHGSAIVIHRIWQQTGLKMKTWLAWLITFNFINITWVFFRAGEWSDASKVLKGMAGLNGVILPIGLQKYLSILNPYGIMFGDYWSDINGSIWMVVLLLLGLYIIRLKNSQNHLLSFIPNTRYAFYTAFMLVLSMMSMHKISEFLYFNF